MAKNPLAGSWNNSGNLGCQFPELFGLPISACLAGNCLSVRLLNLTLRQLFGRCDSCPFELIQNQMTPEHFKSIIQLLPRADGLTGAQPNKWFSCQQEHWIGWLDEYDGPGYYGRKNHHRDAQYIFNHVSNYRMVTWLGEASGVRLDLVMAALDAASLVSNPTSKAAASRRILTWDIVWDRLQTWDIRLVKP